MTLVQKYQLIRQLLKEYELSHWLIAEHHEEYMLSVQYITSSILICPKLLDTMTREEIVGGILHEIGHIKLNHWYPDFNRTRIQAELDADLWAVREGADPKSMIQLVRKIMRHHNINELSYHSASHPDLKTRINNLGLDIDTLS